MTMYECNECNEGFFVQEGEPAQCPECQSIDVSESPDVENEDWDEDEEFDDEEEEEFN